MALPVIPQLGFDYFFVRVADYAANPFCLQMEKRLLYVPRRKRSDVIVSRTISRIEK